MRWFPWLKEKRETNSYTDARVLATLTDAEGTNATVHQIAALEAAAGLYAACLAGARLTPDLPALSPACLSLVGRDLIRNGESVHLIRLDGDQIRLLPAASWDVRGNQTPNSWFYRVDIFGPTADSPTSEIVSGAEVLHIRYSTSPARPWYGIGPLSWASKTGSLAGGLEARLSGEAQGASGYVMPLPADGGDDDNDPLASLKTDLAKGGKTYFVETTAAGFGEGKMAAPQSDWQAKRYGIDPPEAVGNLRDAAAIAVLNACQVPQALFDDADGTAQREAWRRFAMGPLAGIASIIQAEVADKLMTPVKFDFRALWAHDLAGRASSFQKLVAGGMDMEKAPAASGVLMEDDYD